MAGNRIVYTLDFKANFKDVQGQLTTLRESLNEVANMRIGENGFGARQLQKASDAALMLQKHLRTALDPNTGKLDLSRLQTQLRFSGQSARQLALDLVSVGPKGAQSFMQITNAVINAQQPMMRLGSMVTKLGATFMNTVRWQISSRVLYGFMGTFSNALSYASELDKILNHIQRVTGDSKASMDAFAVSANKAAKELGASTKQVAEATLIYRQQGDSAEEAAKKAQITIKAANAAGTEAKEMSEYLTGIWNSYKVGSESLELFIDKLVRVGAVTATSAEEMATSMTKVAATANAVGVTYDQLLATISTVSAATRISAEQVGTAFKTIYARMGDLSLEGSVKEGDLTTTLGAVSGVVDQVGIKVFGANGQLRDTGAIVEDIGNKWAVLDINQKTAIAEALAGKRQYTQLFALFENWDEYNRALTETGKAQGELNRQQAIYLDSVEGAKARFKAEKEEFQIQLFDPDMVQGFIEAITIILGGFNDMIEAADGLGNVLFMIGGLLISKFAPQITNGLGSIITGMVATLPFAGERAAKKFVQQWHAAFSEIRSMSVFSSPVDQATLDTMERMMMLQNDINKAGKEMTDIEKEKLNIIMNEAKSKQEDLATSRAAVAEAEKSKKIAQENIVGASGKTSFVSLSMKQGFFDMSKQSFDPEVSNLLFQGLDKSKVTIQEMTANLNSMENDMREVALIDIATVFNDGKWPTETLLDNVRSLFDAETQVLEQTYNFNQQNTEANSILAEIQTLLTGNVHIYDKETGAIVNINDKILEWKQHLESGNNLLEQRKKKEEEILELQTKGVGSGTVSLKQLKNEWKEIDNKIKEATMGQEEFFNSHANVPKGGTKPESLPKTTKELKQDLKVQKKAAYDARKDVNKYIGQHEGDIDTSLISAKSAKEVDETVTALQKEEKLTEENRVAAEKLKKALNAEAEVNKTKEKLQSLKGGIQQFGQGITETIGRVASLTMSISMIGSSISTISDESKTTAEKAMAWGMLLTSATTALNGVKSVYNGIQAISNALIGEEITKKKVQLIQTEAENASLIKKIALYIKLAAVKNPYAFAAVAIVAATAAIIAFNKETSEAEKQERRFNAAAKQLEEGMKKQDALEQEISNLEDLGEKLREAQGDTQALANITKELNEVLGISVDLVSGGSSEYEKANAILEKHNKLKQQQLETQRKQNLENAKIKLASVTSESSGRGAPTSNKINSKEARKVYQKFLSLNKEKRDEIMYEGGTLTIDLGGDLDNEDFQIDQLNDIKEKISTAAKEAMDLISPNLNIALVDQQSLIDSAQFNLNANEFIDFIDVLSKNQTALNEAIVNNNSEMVISIMNGLFTSSEATNEIIKSEKEKILKMIDEDKADIAKLESQAKTRSQVNTDMGSMKSLGEVNMTMVEAFNKNGGFTDEEIQKYLEKAKSVAKLSETEVAALENELLDPALTEAKLGALMDNVTSRVLNDIDLMKNAATDTAQVIKTLENSGIANATETANRMKNIYELVTRDQERFTNIFKKTGIVISVLDDEIAELQSQYGMTAEEATSLAAQQNIIANTGLNIDEKIIALRQYASAFDGVNGTMANFLYSLDKTNKVTQWNQIDKSKIDMIKDLGYKKGDNGEIVNTRTGEKVDDLNYDIAATKIQFQSRVDFELEYISQSKKERDELIKEHNKAIKDWEKDNILEHINDSILELEATIEKFNRKTASLDFTKDLFGEDTPIDIYIQKVENFKNITKTSVENWDELMSMESDTAEGMEAILAAKESTLDNWRQSILDAREAEDQLYDAKIQLVEEAGTGLTNVIEKQHELISITLEGMQKLLELNESGDSNLAKKGALAQMIGQVAGALSEYDKEIREQERASKKRLDIRNEETQQILEMNQRMEDEINKYALDALKQGIIDRQAERDLERQEIIKDFNETANAIDARISESYNKLEETYGPFIERLDEYMGISSGKASVITVDGKNEYRKDFGYTTSARYEELLDDGSEVVEVGDNWVKVKAKGNNGKYENEYTYTFNNTKSGEAPIINVKQGQIIDKGTILASNTTGYTMTSTKQLGKIQEERFGINKPENLYKIVSVEPNKDNTVYTIKLEGKTDATPKKLTWKPPAPVFSRGGNSQWLLHENGKKLYVPEPGQSYEDSGGKNGYYYDTNTSDNLITINDSKYYSKEWLKNHFGSFASGADSTPAGEAWIGELGRELIILPDGKVIMAGEDGIELANLPAGARVLTNEETEKILKNKKDYTNIQDSESGFAKGTKFHVNEQNLTQETVDFNEEYFSEDVENYKESIDEKLQLQGKFKEENLKYLNTLKTDSSQKATEIKTETDATLQTIDSTTKLTTENLQNYVNTMEFKIPKVDDTDFITSLNDTFTKILEIFDNSSTLPELTKEQRKMYGSKNGWMDPVANTPRVTSPFGNRVHPISGKVTFHAGTDLAATEGAIIVAPRDGVVITNAYQAGRAGNYIVLDVGEGYTATFMHMQKPSPLKVGTKVSQGDPIGIVGNTGGSKGAHLHYEIRLNGKATDSRSFLSYAVGGTTKAGKALVGEYGKEIILYPDGTAGLLGESGMEYANLPAGAHIIPAEETAKILNNPVDKRIPAYAEGTELNLGNDTNLSMERDYLKVTLSPEEVSYLKKIYNIIDESKDEVTSELHQALQNRASEMGYSTLRDVLVETFGYEDLAKRDFKNYKKSMMNVEGFEYIQGLEKDYLTQVFSPEEVVFLKGLFKLEDTSETVTDELHATMQGRAKDRGYGTLRDVGVEIYGEEGMLKREWESGYSTKFSVEQLKALQKDITTNFREFYGNEIISDLLNLWKLDPSSEEFEIETDRQQLDTIFKSRDFYQQQVDELVAQLETYEDFVARGIIARNDEYRAILSEAIEATGEKLEEIDSQFQNRLDTKIDALEKYYDEYKYYYGRLIEDENRLIETLEGRKGVWETYYGEYNELLDTQHSINKELQKSKTLTQWLDAKTREQVFNEKDYLQYTQKINEHMLEAEKDRLLYEKEINALGKYESEKIALLTEEYQERVELRKKELNILKEELQLQKKQNALNTALMERNVRVFSGGRWIQIANVENVAKAQEELEDTKYNISKAERELDQTNYLNEEFNQEIRESKEVIADWNAALTEAEDKMNHSIHELTSTIDIGKGSFQDLFGEINSVMKQLKIEKEAFEKGESAPKTVKSSYNGVKYSGKIVEVKIDGNAPSGTQVGDVVKTAGGDYLVVERGTNGSSYNLSSGLSSIKIDKNATGTRDSQSGFSLVNEKGVEMLSTKYGQIIELNPHQKIFNNDQLNYLYDVSREGIAGMSKTVSAMTANSNMISIDTLHIALDNVTNAESFIDGLKNLNQYIKNTRTINRS